MAIPTFMVDFHEMVDENRVLLSKDDFRLDINQNMVILKKGMKIKLVMEDCDENGNPDDLVAAGTAEFNTDISWSKRVKWVCYINEHGIKQKSEYGDPGIFT